MEKGTDYRGVAAVVCIRNEEAKCFVALRGKGARDEIGTWEFPGGCVEFG